jgi:hypothetical protein
MPRRNDEYLDLESFLTNALQPVKPRAEFVSTVKSHIAQPDVRYKTELNKQETLILVVAGVSSSVLLLLAGIRAIYFLIFAYRTLRNS